MSWRTVATQHAAGHRRSATAVLGLAAAYHDVFSKADESTEMVLADLATFCGFYQVPPPGTTSDEMHRDAGRREAFARILSFLTLSSERMQALEEAARQEGETNQMEGPL